MRAQVSNQDTEDVNDIAELINASALVTYRNHAVFHPENKGTLKRQ